MTFKKCRPSGEVRHFYATVNYRKNIIKSYFSESERDYSIHYVEEDKPLGTAGSLRLIQEEFDNHLLLRIAIF